MKKIIAALLLAALLLAALLLAGGCMAKETEYPVMEIVDLTPLTLEAAESDTLRAMYPTGEWVFDVSLVPADFAIYDVQSLAAETGTANINIMLAGKYSGKLKQRDFDGMLDELKNTDAADGMSISVAELRTFAGEPTGYIESTTTFTESMVDFYIANSGITEEQLAAIGGREALLRIPPTYQMLMYAVVDGNILVVSGTYYDDASKTRVLEQMKILLQTIVVK